MNLSSLPDGIFKTFLYLWELFRNTYVAVYDWVGKTGFGDYGTVLTILVGSGLLVVLGYKIVKFLLPW